MAFKPINRGGDEALSDEITDMDQWMRQMIAEQHLPEDTWFVLRSNAGGLVSDEMMQDLLLIVGQQMQTSVLGFRFPIVPPDQIWLAHPAIDEVEVITVERRKGA